MDAMEIVEAYKKLDIKQKIVAKRDIELCDAELDLQIFKSRMELAIKTIEEMYDPSLSVEWVKKNILGL